MPDFGAEGTQTGVFSPCLPPLEPRALRPLPRPPAHGRSWVTDGPVVPTSPPTPTGRRSTPREDLGIHASTAFQHLQTRLDAVAGGRVLFVMNGVAVPAAAPLLTPAASGWIGVTVVSAAMIAVLVISTLIDWERLPRSATLAFPFAVFASMTALGLAAPSLTNALTGVLMGAFVYTGLTQHQGSSVVVVPLGSAAFVAMNGGLDRPVAIRLAIGVMVSTMIVEILAAFSTQQRRNALVLRRAAHTDPLTGVGNRRDLDDRLAGASGHDVVVLCDLDHFKQFNDSRGHQAGDEVLRDFGRLLRVHLRGTDYCARYGGEEFRILLTNASVDSARAVVRRLRSGWAKTRPGL